MKVPVISGFVGFRGDNVWLDQSGYPDDHPLVVARPDLFTDAPRAEKKGIRRPPKVKAEPKPVVTPPKAESARAEINKGADLEAPVEAVEKSD